MKYEYRPEIDGLRAIAVLAVVFFHASPTIFPNGYLGVDVFFVISGYLISSLIYKDSINGRFSISFFYEKRARRILPALFFIIFVSLILSLLILLPESLENFSKSIFYTISFTSNIFFYNQVGYFDIGSELKPLLHTWSLSVEEQFYLIFPVICLLIFKRNKYYFNNVMIFLFLFSFAIAIFLNNIQNKEASFYFIQSRMWEFLAGACTGLVRNRFNSIKNYSGGLYIYISSFGLIIILISLYGLWDFKEKEFLQILIVVLGTTLVIAFSNSFSGFGKFLAFKALVGIGLISFSAYLWHQPIFVFYRYFNISPISLEIYFLLIILVFVLSFFTWKYVELPFRDVSLFSRKKFINSSLIFGAIILGFSIFVKYHDGLPSRFSLDSSVIGYFNEKNECTANEKHFEPCIVGNLNRPEIDILVVGDSHSKSIMPAFNLLGKQDNLKVARIGAPGCPPLLGIYVLKGNGHEKDFCPEVADRQLEFAIKNNIKKVIFVARWAKYFDVDQGGNRSFYLGFSSGDMIDNQMSKLRFMEKFKLTVGKYQQAGVKVLILTQIPEQVIDSKEIYYLMSRQKSDKDREKILENYSVKNLNHINSNKAFSNFLNSMEVKTINLDSFFCNLEMCKVGTVSQPYFKDHHHLSVIGARSLTPLLRDELSAYGFLH